MEIVCSGPDLCSGRAAEGGTLGQGEGFWVCLLSGGQGSAGDASGVSRAGAVEMAPLIAALEYQRLLHHWQFE